MVARAQPAAGLSTEAQRLLQFVRFNEPAGPIGSALILGVLVLVRDAFVLIPLGAALLNWALVVRARHLLRRDRIEPAVLMISIGMWALSFAIWLTLPRIHGLAVIIQVMPIVLAAAYIRRQYVVPIMATSVGVATLGAAFYPFQPIFAADKISSFFYIGAISVFVPLLTASIALSVWHSVSRLLEVLEETRAANRALAESERLLERKVEERTADLEESQRDLARARDEALAANRAKSTFLANMSHELRTPLNAIIGYSEMLQEDASDAGHDDYVPDLERIVASGKHLLGLINDVLDLSKIEAGRVELLPETFEVDELVRGAANTVAPLVERNRNHLEVEVASGTGTMYTDLTRVRQILFNLLSNAAKFTKEGTITITAERESPNGGDQLVFGVADTGIGMSQEQLGRIFDAFSQAESSTTRDYGGTGLGLTITKLFCEMLGGDIDVRSEPGRGSEFRVRLPAILPEPGESAAAEAETAEASEPVPATARATILVIDDEQTARDLMRRFLEREGYAVMTAAGGEEGLRLARERRPDLITLDVLMPHTDGWSVLSTLKADPELRDVPVVVVTMVDDQRLGYALGAVEYVAKPFDRDRLANLVRRHTRTRGEGPVLVVDDDPQNRELLRRTVERAGFEAVEAANGREALAAVEQSPPRLVLLDLLMPEMDGFEFLATLRQREVGRGLPVVVVTAKELTADERATLQGATEKVLQKGSTDRSTLSAQIRQFLEAAVEAPEG